LVRGIVLAAAAHYWAVVVVAVADVTSGVEVAMRIGVEAAAGAGL
jgi:hypothetical protein